ncbi:MAG: hypothetical protein JO248_15005 [Acidimicrobiia bacterium]|nr:hypothetical protein [Acidimicrobiia bacterium]
MDPVSAPTLIISRPQHVSIRTMRLLEAEVPGARRIQVAGIDIFPWLPDSDTIVAEVEDFVTGERHGDPQRALCRR